MSSGNLIIGAGGHGKVVADAMLTSGMAVIGFLDDNVNVLGQYVLGLPVVGSVDQWLDFNAEGLVIAVGNNTIRRKIHQKLEASGRPNWITVTHPKAVLAKSVTVGVGTVVMAGVVVNPDTVIGRHTILNTGSTVDHDCIVGEYVHIAPGVHLSGGVHVGDNSLIGIGSAVIPSCHIGKDTTVGAGAVVVRNVPDDVIAKGVPARWDS